LLGSKSDSLVAFADAVVDGAIRAGGERCGHGESGRGEERGRGESGEESFALGGLVSCTTVNRDNYFNF
jgi:hypothetical protein